MTDLAGRWRVAILGGLFIVSVAMAARMVRPFQSGSVGPDAIAPVIEFERLTAGQALEGRLTQTSKPILDLVYGPLFSLFHDWRPIAWAAILAFALCVVLATVLAYRVAGLASATFAAAAFLLSPILLVDLSLAYAIVWMLLFLLVAGLAVTAERPRYGVAGIALMLAALARPEALAVMADAAAALVGAELGLRGRNDPDLRRVPISRFSGCWRSRCSWPTTDSCSAIRCSGRRRPRSIRARNRGLNADSSAMTAGWRQKPLHRAGRAAALGPPAAAVFDLSARRQLGARHRACWRHRWDRCLLRCRAAHVDLSARYLVPIDLGLLFAAAIGVSALDVPAIRRWARQRLRPAAGRWRMPSRAGWRSPTRSRPSVIERGGQGIGREAGAVPC